MSKLSTGQWLGVGLAIFVVLIFFVVGLFFNSPRVDDTAPTDEATAAKLEA